MWINRFFILFFALLTPGIFYAQNTGDLSEILSEAEKLHREYRFDDAIDRYNIIIETSSDSLVRQAVYQRVLQCENGLVMLDFSTEPTVVARKRVPLQDFYLSFYDLGDKAWILNPNPFVSLPHPYYQSIYKPKDAVTIYYSAPGEKGNWNIYRSSMINDTLWSEPVMLSDNINSAGDDIFPMLSPDGKELFFASNGHYGMGGFDLYVSRWSSEINDWGAAENLGFPLSTPGNDIFFANSPDGLYSILVSDRNTLQNNMVDIFILSYDSTPVRKMIESPDQAKKIASLNISVGQEFENEQKTVSDKGVEDTVFDQYTLVITEIGELRAEHNSILNSIENRREQYLTAKNAEDKKSLEKKIAEEELNSLEIKDKLEKKIAEAQQIEMDFITQGITPRVNTPAKERETEAAKEREIKKYSFKNANFGHIGDITVIDPIPKFDYSFRILNKSIFADEMPDGVIYQIQLMVTSTKASESTLKGLTPIFETKTSTGKYLYTVGAFRTNAEASSHLNSVKRAGFSSAFIIAYNNGKSITINEAKKLEQNGSVPVQTPASASGKGPFRIIVEGYPEGLPEPVLSAIKANTNKDLARMEINGQNVYVIAPFASQKDAEKLISTLNELAVEHIKLESINR